VVASTVTFGSQSSLREANRGRILEVIRKFGAITQVELADATGLSPGTISVIVKELHEAGVITTKPTSRNGRRAVLVTLSRRLGLVAGVVIGRRDMRVGLASPAGEILAEQHLPLGNQHRGDTGLDRVALFVTDMVERIGANREELLGVGCGIAAPIDRATGMICSPGLMRGWDDIPIGQSLQSRMGVPVVVDNSANLGCLAESRLGAGQGASPVAYLSVGHGIGLGLSVDNQIFHGFSGTAGEIGHMCVDENGPICYCGNRGCLEAIAGSTAMLESLRLTHGNLSLADLIRQTQDGDIACRRVIDDATRYIAIALGAVCNLLDPQRVVVGGPLVDVGQPFLDPLTAYTARFTLPGARPTIEILPGRLGERCELLGAIAYALDTVHLPGDLEGVTLHALS
jgi:predicted NBD/HSP70 family sugar kinase